MLVVVFREDFGIVQVQQERFSGMPIEYNVECTLRCRRGAHTFEEHLLELLCSSVAGEGGFVFIFFCHRHLPIAPDGAKCQDHHHIS